MGPDKMLNVRMRRPCSHPGGSPQTPSIDLCIQKDKEKAN